MVDLSSYSTCSEIPNSRESSETTVCIDNFTFIVVFKRQPLYSCWLVFTTGILCIIILLDSKLCSKCLNFTFLKLELKYRVEKISKIKRVEDELFLLIFFYEVFN